MIPRPNRCWCGGCGAKFNSPHAFRQHAIGAGQSRRCRSPGEMLLYGMTPNYRGFWVTQANVLWQPRRSLIAGERRLPPLGDYSP